MDDSKVHDALNMLHLKNSRETLETLPNALIDLTFEEKRQVLAELLCEEWYLIEHFDYIKDLLDVFANSINK